MSRKVEKHLKLTYPAGCKEITEELSNDELVKRLKLLTRAFQDMSQDDNDEFKQLAIYLASEYFLEHNSKDVKLLVACCIADIFRVFVPDAPYTEPEQLKEIFLFLIDQLKGLKDPESPLFKRYFYLLENLAWVKSFNISLELPDSSEILFRLFKTTLELINDRHNNKVSVLMLDILCPLLSEADAIPQEVLDIFLACIIEPFKTQNRPAFEMARDLIRRTTSVLEPYIELFLSNCLIQSSKSEKSSLSGRVYDLIQELNNISPSLLQNVLPQLELKLKSADDAERMAATKLLTKMFAAPNSDLALQHKQLWNAFLGRFNDIDLNIRRMTVQSCQDIIINHAELVTEEAAGKHLKHRQHDSDENVRMDVVKVIVASAKAELKHVPDDLLECVKERTLDKKFKVRREALVGLGQIYKKCHEVGGDVRRVAWIRNKVLHAYYQLSIDDKILVERILNTSLVPYSMDPPSRMKQLYLLYSNLDEHAIRALQEIFKTQAGLRNIVKNILDLQQKGDSPDVGQAINTKILALSRHLPEPEKACQQLHKFFKSIQESKIRQSLQNLINAQCECKKAEEHVKEIIKKLGNSTPQNLLYATVKQLLERIAPLMIDNLSILALIILIQKVIQSKLDGNDEDDDEEDEEKQGRKERLHQKSGLNLLLLLSQNFAGSFQMNDIYTYLLEFIKYDDDVVVDMTMQILKNVGAGIDQTFPEVHSSLLPVLQKMIKVGTTKQAKHAVRCIDVLCKDKVEIFGQLFQQLQQCMNLESSNLLTSIVAIGHLCQLCPSKFVEPTDNIISMFIMKEVLMQDRTVGRKKTEDWCEEKHISEETLIKLESVKMIGRWLLGLKDQNNCKVSPIMRMLYTMILCEGDLMERGHINKPEMSRLRLHAGCCMLKVAQEPAYADAIKLEQFETMALLINDPCVEVRQIFVSKLHRGLMNLRLPIQYMGIMCLGALDPIKERRSLIKQMLAANINRRRDYIRQNPSCATSCTVYSILPDYVLPYSLHLLAHDPDLVAYDNVPALRSIKDCLLFLLEPLLTKNDTVSFEFYSKILANIKNTVDAQCPDSEEANKKLYATCDLAMNLLLTKMSCFSIKNFPAEPVLPTKLFKPLPSVSRCLLLMLLWEI
ncbi:hypothetical protein HELRODRAFT_62692 [Helobdella robusta]|uniref:Sister chromatid cohesion protein n=1 Tax=Helobdella robusta TaxID=6412 RepID=T1FX36_HELRO|nr:hypothetical protein HELRODRAFT_62692 [Helobdella robusta]ESO11948.1 hypothetical protein HELRODRAFT_62692 [Helobdella robusta]